MKAQYTSSRPLGPFQPLSSALSINLANWIRASLMMRHFILLVAFAASTVPAFASQWQVGPGQTYTMPSQVSTLVADGDTVNIAAGTYPSDVARWVADDLLLRGVGGMAHLESNGNAFGSKGIWVITGDRTTVEHIEFSECAVPDHNGAGIRQQGKHLTVRHCYFHNNQNGILADAVMPSTIRIEHTEFAHNGYGDGYSHNVYINKIDSLIFRYNYSHHASGGDELKSRARVNVIEYDRFGDEATGNGARQIHLPNGGQSYLIGNVIQQGQQSQSGILVSFGQDALDNPGPHELYAVNNTMVNEKSTGSFFIMPGAVSFKAYSNILAGSGNFMYSAFPTALDTAGNLRSPSISSVSFNAPGTYDFHLTAISPALQTGVPAGTANNGYPLTAFYEYTHPVGGQLRCQQATLDAGAYEFCTVGIAEQNTSASQVWPNPTSDVVNISTHHQAVIEVIDASGRIVRTETAKANTVKELSLGDLANGYYSIVLIGSHGKEVVMLLLVH